MLLNLRIKFFTQRSFEGDETICNEIIRFIWALKPTIRYWAARAAVVLSLVHVFNAAVSTKLADFVEFLELFSFLKCESEIT